MLVSLLNCTGSRGLIKFNQLKHPTSMSPFLPSKEGKNLDISQELKIIKKIEISKTYWGILYGFVSLNSSNPFASKLNEEIEKANAYGAVNFKIRVDSCFINEIMVLNIFPFWPGCSIVTLNANLVEVVSK